MKQQNIRTFSRLRLRLWVYCDCTKVDATVGAALRRMRLAAERVNRGCALGVGRRGRRGYFGGHGRRQAVLGRREMAVPARDGLGSHPIIL